MAETKPGHLAIATKSNMATFKFPLELIERILYEVAAQGGNCTAAKRTFDELNEHRAEQGEDKIDLPSVRTIRHWITGPFRNRYHEIVSDSARQLEELVAAQGVSLAISIGTAEEDALKQTLAGLANANGVEASQILRNLSQAKGTAIDKAQLLRGRPTQISGTDDTLEALARELQKLGIVEVVEGTAVED